MWERSSREVKNEGRWKRNVLEWEKKGGGGMKSKESVEKIPLTENFELGREEEGPKMNNSGRLRNNFETNREALFQGGTEMRRETRNWVASSTKDGLFFEG